MDKYEVLKRYFGYTSFREGQEELVDGIIREFTQDKNRKEECHE